MCDRFSLGTFLGHMLGGGVFVRDWATAVSMVNCTVQNCTTPRGGGGIDVRGGPGCDLAGGPACPRLRLEACVVRNSGGMRMLANGQFAE